MILPGTPLQLLKWLLLLVEIVIIPQMYIEVAWSVEDHTESMRGINNPIN